MIQIREVTKADIRAAKELAEENPGETLDIPELHYYGQRMFAVSNAEKAGPRAIKEAVQRFADPEAARRGKFDKKRA